MRLAVFDIFAVKWQKSVSERPTVVHPSPFHDPTFGDPLKISTPKGEQIVAVHSSTITSTFMPI